MNVIKTWRGAALAALILATGCGGGSGLTPELPPAPGAPTREAVDHNYNGIDDADDILAGTSLDENGNGIVDEVEIDLDGDGTLDGRFLVGQAFEDINWNGIQDAGETAVVGVTVAAMNKDGVMVGSTTTDANGNWQLADVSTLQGLHVVFSGWESTLVPGFGGASTGTTCQFAVGSRVGMNLSLQRAQFCDTREDAAPWRIAVPCYVSGTRDGDGAALDVIVSSLETHEGESPSPRSDAVSSEVGSTWGMAFEPRSRRLFAAAVVKRHADLGPQGIGGVYVLDYNGATVDVVGQFTLQGVVPANGGAAINLGDVKRTDADAGIAVDYELPANPNANSVDLDAFDKVGKAAFGDIDVSEDLETLWMVNLNQLALISLDVSDAAVVTPAEGAQVNQYLLEGLPGWPVCPTYDDEVIEEEQGDEEGNELFKPGSGSGNAVVPSGRARPFGLTFCNGRGYLGVVCTGETSKDDTHLSAHVLSFDPANVAAGFTNEVTIDMNYNRERGGVFGGDPATWHAWATTWADTGFPNSGGERTFAQPMLSDIEFTDDGAMVLGFCDRWGHQSGFSNAPAVAGQIASSFTSNSGGDTILVCNVDGEWVVEGDPGAADDTRCPVNDVRAADGGEQRGDDGPSNRGEFFYDDQWFGQHLEVTQGGLALRPGTAQVIVNAFDPTDSAFSQGFHWYSTEDGSRPKGYRILGSPGFGFGKAAGLGDVELLCSPAPVQIGSTLFSDNNMNGEQDGGDSPLANVMVTLLCDGVEIATETTNASGDYFFGEHNVEGGLMPNQSTCYQVCVSLNDPALNGALPTSLHADGVSTDSDSDGDDTIIDGSVCTQAVTPGPGLVNHSFDFGFLPTGKLGDQVWYDANADGVFDEGEPVFAGLGLIVCNAGTDGVPGNADDVEVARVTSAAGDGTYTVCNLRPDLYSVKVDPATMPAGHAATTMDPRVGFLSTNQTRLDYDIGIVETYVLGQQVFVDSNQNGTFDPQIGEAPIPGVVVVLCDLRAGQETQRATTDDNGRYQFVVTPGEYEVKVLQDNYFGVLSGYVATSQPDDTAGAAITNGDDLSHEFGFNPLNPTPVRHFCGWWVDNPGAWPLARIPVGNEVLSREQAIGVLNDGNQLLQAQHSQAIASVPRTLDMSYVLAWAQIGAKLNVAAGNNPVGITQAMMAADAWLIRNGGISSNVRSNNPEWDSGYALFTVLNNFNQGG